MHLAAKGVIPTKEWIHNPELNDCDNMTVAMKFALR